MAAERSGPADHPIVVGLLALAAVATILTFLVQVGTISFPFIPPFGGGTCTDPSISLSDGSAPSGTQVVVTGRGFDTDSTVTLRFHTEAMQPARTDDEGSFEAAVVIPGTFDPFAPTQLTVTAATGPCAAATPFGLTRAGAEAR
ncbi:immunoglobulin domain-containing protein [Actinotalea sp. K2]|uniref:immunoglobulin domain-containing protein n=1 Tax=Actinotalea sp. K2 TaxID=2939438 RepID=UPI002017DCCB|nr:immunoglobulin domain-containing protein [Actinotalea sp. K2]MCL3860411.1 immunoglobulin domain-containing protein [Actinotalea sp. K2]